MGSIFSSLSFHKDPLLPVKYVDVSVGVCEEDLENYYDKHHNNTIADAYLWVLSEEKKGC